MEATLAWRGGRSSLSRPRAGRLQPSFARKGFEPALGRKTSAEHCSEGL
jgi:hypothetical protein